MASIKLPTAASILLLTSACSETDGLECNWRGNGDLIGYSVAGESTIKNDELLELRLLISSGPRADAPAETCAFDKLVTTNAQVTTGIGAPSRELLLGSSGNPNAKMYFGYRIANRTLLLESSGINTCLSPREIHMSADPGSCKVIW